MAGDTRAFGIVGLGNIGGNLAAQALARGFRVVGYDRRQPDPALVEAGLEWAGRLSVLAGGLAAPRAVLLYVPAGPVVDSVLDELIEVLEPGDVVADGGNSYWGDSMTRHRRMAERGLRFADVGTSGGVPGAHDGACFMAGGDAETIAVLEPILLALSVEGGYVHAGPPGAGHFAKLVHNGIEFGMLQAIGEGVELLRRYRDNLPVADILRCWTNGSVIRSWLVELMEQQFRAQGGLERVPGYVEDTGEVNWLVDDAMQMEVPIPVITQSAIQLLASRDADRNWARAVAMMRHGFGNHPFGPDKRVAANRPSSRIGPFRREG